MFPARNWGNYNAERFVVDGAFIWWALVSSISSTPALLNWSSLPIAKLPKSLLGLQRDPLAFGSTWIWDLESSCFRPKLFLAPGHRGAVEIAPMPPLAHERTSFERPRQTFCVHAVVCVPSSPKEVCGFHTAWTWSAVPRRAFPKFCDAQCRVSVGKVHENCQAVLEFGFQMRNFGPHS